MDMTNLKMKNYPPSDKRGLASVGRGVEATGSHSSPLPWEKRGVASRD